MPLRNRLTNPGFIALELLVVALVAVAIASIGYYAYKHGQDTHAVNARAGAPASRTVVLSPQQGSQYTWQETVAFSAATVDVQDAVYDHERSAHSSPRARPTSAAQR